jgi:hypothetical protein
MVQRGERSHVPITDTGLCNVTCAKQLFATSKVQSRGYQTIIWRPLPMSSTRRILIFLFSPFLPLPPCLDFDGLRHKLVARSFEAFGYFRF